MKIDWGNQIIAMRSTRSSTDARRVTMDSNVGAMPYDEGDDDDQFEAETKGGSGRSRRRGSVGVDTLQSAGGPRSSRLRQSGGGGPRYAEVDSDDDAFYGHDVDDDRSSRSSRGRTGKVAAVAAAVDGGGDKRRRSSRGVDHGDVDEEDDVGAKVCSRVH